MKHLFSLLFLSLFFVACGGSPEGTEVTSGDALADGDGNSTAMASAEFVVDPSASMITWEGTKAVGGGHQGTIPVEDGRMVVTTEDGNIVSGKFSMDMSKMVNTDLPEEDGAKLVGHLQAPDFFDVAQYPTADFNLVKISPMEATDHTHMISGNLTMKGKERSVTIPATITIDGDKMTAETPKFTIDRNDWGVSYGNSIVQQVKDKIISDELGLQITLVANRE
ncbi:YceI family protein [Neolewinella antarctica]|uniref:Polyisoprenoid-binding protein YceI n=1 Tax=Neolewinella antarctica TaxID=442734 RepID=A0ABX0XHA3_9BACT|nr:YceI family protein [Neolewinella antarctica]NJC28243.1 polyisoprenoid-binding protein YceI [Neolewinella antarctica]